MLHSCTALCVSYKWNFHLYWWKGWFKTRLQHGDLPHSTWPPSAQKLSPWMNHSFQVLKQRLASMGGLRVTYLLQHTLLALPWHGTLINPTLLTVWGDPQWSERSRSTHLEQLLPPYNTSKPNNHFSFHYLYCNLSRADFPLEETWRQLEFYRYFFDKNKADEAAVDVEFPTKDSGKHWYKAAWELETALKII